MGAADGSVDVCEWSDMHGCDTITRSDPTHSVNINSSLVNINSIWYAKISHLLNIMCTSGAVGGCVDICELLEISGHGTITVVSPMGAVNINPDLVNINSRLAYNILTFPE